MSQTDRRWALRNIDVDEQALNSKEMAAAEEDMETFMQEIEADKDMRRDINLYKNSSNKKSMAEPADVSGRMNVENGAGDTTEDFDDENIKLEELLDDLTLSEDLGSIKVLSAEEALAQAVSTQEALLAAGVAAFDVGDMAGKAFTFT